MLLVYDITARATYINLTRLLNELMVHTETGWVNVDTVAMLVGNKRDLEHLRAIPTDEAKAFASAHISPLFAHTCCLITLPTVQNNLLFVETSAVDASNVESPFHTVLAGVSNAFATRGILLMFFQRSAAGGNEEFFNTFVASVVNVSTDPHTK